MITLRAGDSSVVIAPEIGGAMVGWLLGDRHVLRGPDPEALLRRQVRGLSGFPLVPFSNRIAYGRFTWEGQTYQLARNFGDHPHTIHGVGWQSPWEVMAVTLSSVDLALDWAAQGEQVNHWPFPFAATLRYALDASGLTVTLSMTNRWSRPAPAGLGLHPYFPRHPGASVQFRASGVWLNGADSLPHEHVPVPPEWDHSAGKPVGSAALDNLFTGWDRSASISLGGGPRLVLTADEVFERLVVYTPAGKDYFCVEPVSHMTDAINRLDQPHHGGLRVLAPDESFLGEVKLNLIH